MPQTTTIERGLTRVWVARAAEGSPTAIQSGWGPQPTATGAQLASQLEPLAARVLAVRGLTDPQASAAFLNPSLMHLHDPALVPGLDRAAERILGALRQGEPIVVYGDYDVDGVSATAILHHTLRALSPQADLRTYVPHRIDEGYGLNAPALEQLAADGAKVVVSVDCGITAIEAAAAAARAGLDLIITDHHNPPTEGDELPAAYALVHPRLPGSVYPFGDLCGAGVAFKLAWRLCTLHCGGGRVRPDLRSLLIELLAFASLGVVADVVPLLGENRVIARFGLARIKHSKLIGLAALVGAAGLSGDQIESEHVGFVLGPRLNACGRMGHARDAVELFTTADETRAAEIARSLCRMNDERRAAEQRVVEHAAELAEAAGMTSGDRRAIVLSHPDWHPGVLGIACSRLVERFHRPTILMQTRHGECHGSGRSIEGFSLHAALARCGGLLTRFGGHDMAAGLQVAEAGLGTFVEAFLRDAGEHLDPDLLNRRLSVDCEALLSEMTPAATRQLDLMAPFGQANPRPRILVRAVHTASAAEPLGAEGKHLALRLRQGHPRGGAVLLRAVAWNWGHARESFPAGVELDAVLTPKLNEWNGSVRVEPEVVDLRLR